jgi:1,2-diacylglycerol 3-alpha-glucosyltransferase
MVIVFPVLDVIHVHTEYGVGIFGRLMATQLKLPLVYTYHTMMEDYTHYFTKATLGRFERQVKKFLISSSKFFADKCTELIVPSTKTYKAMKRYGVTNHINVIPTGIDISKYSTENIDENEVKAIKKKYGLNKNDFVAIFVGRLAPEKSVDMIIETFKILKEQRINDIKLLIVGDGPAYDDLVKKVNEYKLKRTVKLVGSVSNEDIPAYYHSAEVFVSTSITETQGLTFIEAMASHLPIVCRYDDNLKNIIDDHKNGFFIENEQEMAEKLIDLADMKVDDYNRLSNNARLKAQDFSSTIFYEKVIIVYENAIRNKRKQLTKIRKNRKRKKLI